MALDSGFRRNDKPFLRSPVSRLPSPISRLPFCGTISARAAEGVVDFDPVLSHALSELGALLAHGEFGRARERANALQQRYPDHTEVWRLSGVCALQQGDFAPARKALDRAIQIAPLSVESWCNLASLHTAQA